MGKLRFYLMTGIAGFVFTFIFSIRNNLWMTSMYRALLACVIWFLLAFLLNWMFAAITGPRAVVQGDVDTQREQDRGTVLDLSTPDEDRELMDLIHSESSSKENGDFVPLNPPKLVSTKEPEELAKAVRHLTEK
ncbi:hypothetical protein AK95_31335 [Paenibacillus sp. LC231]|uniref:hypothetical protein n=1 Tax=unclassified Paenibacillus TaxID=185978 RepID=UPI0008DD89B5|nr:MULTISPECIES: hypothetical protein [unclassified Paenibacillus]MCT1398630.1 hypothetical protein [Paenibacillus sp. p3-SID867]OIB02652.1 hypothetical protein AK95_31335 [Paenibacillus sp. LC231]